MSGRLTRLLRQIYNTQLYCSASSFKYTLNNKILTEKERNFYEKNGYIVKKRFLSEAEVKYYNNRFEELCKEPSKRSKFMLVMRDVKDKNKELYDKTKLRNKSDIVKLQDWQNDKILMEYVRNPNILNLISDFIGENIHSIHTMYFNKPPDKGNNSSRHPVHQDLWYFPFRPADRIVASWSALENIDKKNGCLFIIPGSHKIGTLLKHCYPKTGGIVNKAYHQIQGFNSNTVKNLQYLYMEPGDTVFFHPLLFHGSGPNNSKHFRRAISAHFASSNCHQIKVKSTDVQWSIKKELEEMALKQKIGRITFNQIWQLKNRCLQGKRGLNKWNINRKNQNNIKSKDLNYNNFPDIFK